MRVAHAGRHRNAYFSDILRVHAVLEAATNVSKSAGRDERYLSSIIVVEVLKCFNDCVPLSSARTFCVPPKQPAFSPRAVRGSLCRNTSKMAMSKSDPVCWTRPEALLGSCPVNQSGTTSLAEAYSHEHVSADESAALALRWQRAMQLQRARAARF